MPPRYSYWTILAGGLPTSFRAAAPEDLLPTLRRLKERHPDAEMKWFARGKLWTSPEAAREQLRAPTAPRGREWRPGGEHRDPREKFKTAKRERNIARREQRFRRKHDGPGDVPGPQGDASRRRPVRSARTSGEKAPVQRPGQARPWRSGDASGKPGAKVRDSQPPLKKDGVPWRKTGSRDRPRPPGRPPKGGRGR